jgi:hypothetical protein
MSLGNIRRRPVRRRWLFGITTTVVAAVMVFVVASASGVLTGSPSKFESGDDPSLGLGNMMVDTTGNKDWVSVTANAAYAHITDRSDSTDDSYVSGQKQDTVCPDLDPAHSNPPKDDFTDIASFSETAGNGDTYLYGATIRVAPNGSASENIELKQGTAGNCAGSTILARVAGDKLLTIDYHGGGKRPDFNVLTWVETGACFVSNDVAPCWGASVLSLSVAGAEGGVSDSDITAANNPISGVALKAGRFAEFGVNLATAGILPAGTCKAFPQSIWGSRSSGSSFVSTTKDISIENKTISNCGEIKIIKRSSPRGSDQNFDFTSDITAAKAGSELTCAADASPTAFTLNDDAGVDSNPPVAGGNVEDCTKVHSGTYTVTESANPSGWTFDNFSCTSTGSGTSTNPTSSTSAKSVSITLGSDGVVTCVFTNKPLKGALRILKESTKTGNPLVANAGAEFCYSTSTGCTTTNVTDNGTGDAISGTAGEICVTNLDPGTYYVNETKAPSGYGGASESDQVAVVVADTNCTTAKPSTANTAVFTNPPLSDIQVRFRDGGSGETSATISCDNSTGTGDDNNTTGWDTTHTVTGIDSPTTIDCTITIDP